MLPVRGAREEVGWRGSSRSSMLAGSGSVSWRVCLGGGIGIGREVLGLGCLVYEGEHTIIGIYQVVLY